VFYPFALYVGLRYIRAKRRSHFISFISLTSMIGIALGVMVLIVVLSVMNGFDREIKSRIFSVTYPITISSVDRVINTSVNQPTWSSLLHVLKQPEILDWAPFIQGQALLISAGHAYPLMIEGVSPDKEKNIAQIPHAMIRGNFDLKPEKFGIVLGSELALALGLDVGDSVRVLVPNVTMTPVGIMPRFKTFKVSGIFKIGQAFNFETSVAYIHLRDAQTLFQLPQAVTGVHLKLNDFYAAQNIALKLLPRLSSDLRVNTWMDQYGSLMYAIALEKRMMFLILLLIIAVSAFNLVSSLMMLVIDKAADIAILKTLGATPYTILSIFIIQGGIIGLTGTVLGLIGGIALASNVSHIVHWLEHLLHIQLLTSNVYFFVNELPAQILLRDVLLICFSALGMSLLATLYPAWRAARTNPAEALRYE
jgi:lipoprotein-releasing system permease protein